MKIWVWLRGWVSLILFVFVAEFCKKIAEKDGSTGDFLSSDEDNSHLYPNSDDENSNHPFTSTENSTMLSQGTGAININIRVSYLTLPFYPLCNYSFYFSFIESIVAWFFLYYCYYEYFFIDFSLKWEGIVY